MKEAKLARNTLYGLAAGIILLALLLSGVFTPSQPRFKDIVPGPVSDSDLDTVIHSAHYLARIKGAASSTGFSKFRDLSEFFGQILESNTLGLNEIDAAFLHSISKEIEKYTDFRTFRSEGRNDQTYWSKLFNGRFTNDEVLKEQSSKMVGQSHLKWWDLANRALSMNPFSRFYTETQFSSLESESQKGGAHLLRGKCMWNPYGPPSPGCGGGAPNSPPTNPPPSTPQEPESPAPEVPTESAHLLMKQFLGKFFHATETSMPPSSEPEDLFTAFQTSGPGAVAVALFMDKNRESDFRASVLKCLELVRLATPMDEEDHLFSRYAELFARNFGKPSVNTAADLSDEEWIAVAREGWRL